MKNDPAMHAVAGAQKQKIWIAELGLAAGSDGQLNCFAI
jgi:hypothetical protein